MNIFRVSIHGWFKLLIPMPHCYYWYFIKSKIETQWWTMWWKRIPPLELSSLPLYSSTGLGALVGYLLSRGQVFPAQGFCISRSYFGEGRVGAKEWELRRKLGRENGSQGSPPSPAHWEAPIQMTQVTLLVTGQWPQTLIIKVMIFHS